MASKKPTKWVVYRGLYPRGVFKPGGIYARKDTERLNADQCLLDDLRSLPPLKVGMEVRHRDLEQSSYFVVGRISRDVRSFSPVGASHQQPFLADYMPVWASGTRPLQPGDMVTSRRAVEDLPRQATYIVDYSTLEGQLALAGIDGVWEGKDFERTEAPSGRGALVLCTHGDPHGGQPMPGYVYRIPVPFGGATPDPTPLEGPWGLMTGKFPHASLETLNYVPELVVGMDVAVWDPPKYLGESPPRGIYEVEEVLGDKVTLTAFPGVWPREVFIPIRVDVTAPGVRYRVYPGSGRASSEKVEVLRGPTRIVPAEPAPSVEPVEPDKFDMYYITTSPESVAKARYMAIALELAELVATKQKAYGKAYAKTGQILNILYPKGVEPAQLNRMLFLTRLLDKMFRIATDPTALGEDPVKDIMGYCMTELERLSDDDA